MEEERKYCVYIHTNRINGKKYVGQTVNGNRPHKRWYNGNGYIRSPYFYKAIQKYGWDNFDHEVVANGLTAQVADDLEKLLISQFDTMNPDKGYNLEPGGTKNKKLSESTKEKISKSHMGNKNPMYGVRLIGELNGMYGKHHTDETKRKISESVSGENNGNYRKQMSEEQKQKISQSRLGKYTGEKAGFYGRSHTEESRQKMSKAHKGDRAYNAKCVVQMDDNNNVLRIWKCITDAYIELGICRQSIPEVLNKKQEHAGGYCWFYLYDQIKKDGTVIQGAISLGYVTETDVIKEYL